MVNLNCKDELNENKHEIIFELKLQKTRNRILVNSSEEEQNNEEGATASPEPPPLILSSEEIRAQRQRRREEERLRRRQEEEDERNRDMEENIALKYGYMSVGLEGLAKIKIKAEENMYINHPVQKIEELTSHEQNLLIVQQFYDQEMESRSNSNRERNPQQSESQIEERSRSPSSTVPRRTAQYLVRVVTEGEGEEGGQSRTEYRDASSFCEESSSQTDESLGAVGGAPQVRSYRRPKKEHSRKGFIKEEDVEERFRYFIEASSVPEGKGKEQKSKKGNILDDIFSKKKTKANQPFPSEPRTSFERPTLQETRREQRNTPSSRHHHRRNSPQTGSSGREQEPFPSASSSANSEGGGNEETHFSNSEVDGARHEGRGRNRPSLMSGGTSSNNSPLSSLLRSTSAVRSYRRPTGTSGNRHSLSNEQRTRGESESSPPLIPRNQPRSGGRSPNNRN